MADVIIFGTGRGANVAYRYISGDTAHNICAFTVDEAYITHNEFMGLPVVDFNSICLKYPPDRYKMFIPLGFERMNMLRSEKYFAAKAMGYEFISYVSSTIKMIDKIEIGENCFILDNTTINFDVKIGNNVTIWSGCQLGDNTIIEDHNWLSSHVCLSGGVVINSFCFFGNNSTVSHNINISERSFIGAATYINKDTVPGGVYAVSGATKHPFDSERFIQMIKGT